MDPANGGIPRSRPSSDITRSGALGGSPADSDLARTTYRTHVRLALKDSRGSRGDNESWITTTNPRGGTDGREALMARNTYLNIVRALPQPTCEQTFLFAWFVAGAHSWYKHLPVSRKVPIVFFLDPHAGEDLVLTGTGERALIEVTPDSRRFHYTWQTTETYRRRFGYWNYYAPYGTAFLFRSGGGLVNTARDTVRILGDNGDWIRVPRHCRKAGSAKINAFVHPLSHTRLFENCRLVTRLLRKWHGDADVQRAPYPGSASDQIDVAVERWLGAIRRRQFSAISWSWSEFEWLDEDRVLQLQSQGQNDRAAEKALTLFQWKLIELNNGLAEPLDEASQLMRLFGLERHRQINDMRNAMRCVKASIYESH
jgi:hypothetical protein